MAGVRDPVRLGRGGEGGVQRGDVARIRDAHILGPAPQLQGCVQQRDLARVEAEAEAGCGGDHGAQSRDLRRKLPRARNDRLGHAGSAGEFLGRLSAMRRDP